MIKRCLVLLPLIVSDLWLVYDNYGTNVIKSSVCHYFRSWITHEWHTVRVKIPEMYIDMFHGSVPLWDIRLKSETNGSRLYPGVIGVPFSRKSTLRTRVFLRERFTCVSVHTCTPPPECHRGIPTRIMIVERLYSVDQTPSPSWTWVLNRESSVNRKGSSSNSIRDYDVCVYGVLVCKTDGTRDCIEDIDLVKTVCVRESFKTPD